MEKELKQLFDTQRYYIDVTNNNISIGDKESRLMVTLPSEYFVLLQDDNKREIMIQNMDKIQKELNEFFYGTYNEQPFLQSIEVVGENINFGIKANGKSFFYDIFDTDLQVIGENTKAVLTKKQELENKQEALLEEQILEEVSKEEVNKESIYQIFIKEKVINEIVEKVMSYENEYNGTVSDYVNELQEELNESYPNIDYREIADTVNEMIKDSADIDIDYNAIKNSLSNITNTEKHRDLINIEYMVTPKEHLPVDISSVSEQLFEMHGINLDNVTVLSNNIENLTDMATFYTNLKECSPSIAEKIVYDYLKYEDANSKTFCEHLDVLVSLDLFIYELNNDGEFTSIGFSDRKEMQKQERTFDLEDIEMNGFNDLINEFATKDYSNIPNIYSENYNELHTKLTFEDVIKVRDKENDLTYYATNYVRINTQDNKADVSNTISITVKDDNSDDFATRYLVKQNEFTATMNTNKPIFFVYNQQELEVIADNFTNVNSDKFDKNKNIFSLTKVEPELDDHRVSIVLDKQDTKIHYIDYYTGDKISLNYGGSRKNKEARKYLENNNLLDNPQELSLNHILEIGKGIDGKNDFIIKADLDTGKNELVKNVMAFALKNDMETVKFENVANNNTISFYPETLEFFAKDIDDKYVEKLKEHSIEVCTDLFQEEVRKQLNGQDITI